MPPTLSKAATPGITDLKCSHSGCYALFSTFQDSAEHVLKAHSGNTVVVPCDIYEKEMESGQVHLYCAVDEDGEEKN